MSTRSSISLMNKSGQVKLVYCHSDGYLSYNGLMLYLHYQDLSKVEKIMALGDMSSLNEEVEPRSGEVHSFDKRQRNVTVFYGRDRGEDGVEAREYKDFDDYVQNGDFQEYDYLYQEKNKTWYLLNTRTSKLQKLSSLLLKETGISPEEKLQIKEKLDFVKISKEKKKLEKVVEKAQKTKKVGKV